MARKKLGEVLQERGLISAEDLARALEEQQRKFMLLGEVLLERGLINKENLVASLEEVTKVEFVDCSLANVDAEALKLIPREIALRHCALPIAVEGKKLIVVMAEPQNIQATDELRFRSAKIISPRLSFRQDIIAAIELHYRSSNGAQTKARREQYPAQMSPSLANADVRHVEFIGSSTRQANQEALDEIREELRTEPTAAVHLVSATIASAVEKDASDIHIEPQANGLVVRFRIDGILRELTLIPAELQTNVISRIKVLADMDIAERRKPQDGRIVVRVGKKTLDLRISTLPTHHGEKIVIRLLDPSAPRLLFRDLGISAPVAETLHRIIERPQGMLLVTGPTGSGKTTTLYAALNQLRSSVVNIVTVEDPVEYQLEGVNQVQVHAKAGLTFAQCLRSILRQDPNIIMVGEIRDSETAEIALKAAQTGHLVLTTVHTNDAIAAIARLIDLKVSPSLIASSVTGIMSQRLVRKLCICAKRVPAKPEYAAQMIAAGLEESSQMMHLPEGCPTCDGIGYRGRVSVSEILMFDEEVRAMIRSDARPDQIRAVARARGMKTMREDALDKVAQGLTTIEEVLRVVPSEESTFAHCPQCSRELAQTFLFCPYCGTKRRSTSGSEPELIHAGTGDDRQ